MGGQSRGVARRARFVTSGSGVIRRVSVGLVLAVMAAVLLLPGAMAQDQEATVANETHATATSDSEIKSGDIITGLNSGNVIATGDNHQSQVQIHGGNYTSPTYIDFYIDGGWSDAGADAGWNEVVADGPEAGDNSAVGDSNSIDNSEDYSDNSDNSDNSTDICC